MAKNPYAAYKELARDELFGPQNETVESRLTTRRDLAIGRSIRRGIIIIILCWILYFLYLSRLLGKTPTPSSDVHSNAPDDSVSTTHDVGDHAVAAEPNKVPLEVHIMSKCPDARDCLQQLIVPAMEKINDKVDFQLSFIAR